MVKFSVSAELGMPAHLFFVERDSAAFRSLVAKVRSRCSCHRLLQISLAKCCPTGKLGFPTGDEAWGAGYCRGLDGG